MASSTESGSLILKVDSREVTQGGDALDKLSVSAGNAEKSVDSLNETNDQAKARLKAMVSASMEQVQAQNASIASGQRAVQMTDAQRAAVEKLKASTSTQAEISARGAALMAAEERSRKAATIGVAEQTGALSKLLGQIDPTVAGYERLDAMQAKLAAFRKSGAISGDDYTLFSGKIAGMRQELDKGAESVGKFTLNTAASRRELGYITKDLATGQYGRLSQSMSTLAVRSNALSLLMKPMALGIIGVTAVVGGFAVSLYKAAQANADLEKAIILSGHASGMTSEQMKALASSYATVYTNASSVLDIQKGLLATGAFNTRNFREATQAAIAFGEATGQSQKEVISTFDALAKDPVSTLEKINQLYGWITPAVMDHVKALVDQGDKANAVAEAFRAINSAASDTASAEQKASTTIDRLVAKWKNGASEISGYYQKLVNGISPTEQFQLARSTYEAHLQSTQRNSPLDRLFGQVYTPEQLQAEEARLRAMAATLQAQRDVAAQGAQTTDDNKAGNAANSYYDSHFATLDRVAKKQKELNDLTANYEDMWAHTDSSNARLAGVQRVVGADGKVSFFGGNFDRDTAAINDKFADKAPKGKKAPDLSIDITDDYMSKVTEGYKKELTAQAKATIALEDYRQVQEAKLRTSQEALDLQVKSIGMGDREIAMEREIIAIHREADSDLQRLNKQRGQMTQADYDAQLATIKEYEDRRVAAAREADDRIRDAQGQWQNGFRRAFTNYLDQASDVAGQSAELFTNAFTGMGNALTNFVMTGKGGFTSLVNSIITDMVRMEARVAMSQILQQLFSSFMPLPAIPVTGADNPMVIAPPKFNAAGGVYSSPSLSRYSGQVVNKPTMFAFASGAGVMGEAGPEAIMPLKRGSDGKLGVQAAGGGSGIEQVIVSITNHGQPVQATQTGQRVDGKKMMIDLALDAVAGDVAKGGRVGQAMQQRFGLSRRGVPVGGA